jgi:4-hydroxy-3-polyprenylbenzoate decarboxylase
MSNHRSHESSNSPGSSRVVVGITGASGAIYASRLVEELLQRDLDVFLVASSAGRQVIQHELPEHAGSAERIFADLPEGRLHVFHEKDFFAPFCSGSFRTRATVIVPASMGTIGAIASGTMTNALQRAADVALKEQRRLILVPRETPLSSIHLENLLKLSRMGATILPPMPAFYNAPRTIADQVDFVVSRVLDHMDLDNDLTTRWKDPPVTEGDDDHH